MTTNPRIDKRTRWVYARDSVGDIEVWAETLPQVLLALRQHGFISIDVSKIRQG